MRRSERLQNPAALLRGVLLEILHTSKSNIEIRRSFKHLTKLEIIFTIEICLFASKKNENYQIKFTLKFSFFTQFISNYFFIPEMKRVIRGTVGWRNVRSRKYPFGEMSFGEMSVQEIVYSAKCPLENFARELSVGELSGCPLLQGLITYAASCDDQVQMHIQDLATDL